MDFNDYFCATFFVIKTKGIYIMTKNNTKINTKKNFYAPTIFFNDKKSLTYFVSAENNVIANMKAISKFIDDKCDGNNNILLSQTGIRKVICQPTRNKKLPLVQQIKKGNIYF